MTKAPYKSGFVAIVGKPNVGKSTVLNYLLGTDLAIVSPKPETTRDKILGTLTLDKGQINFIDTPGMHIPHTLLGKYMVRHIQEALQEADVVLAIIDAKKRLDRDDRALFDALKNAGKISILLINKVDLIDKRYILPVIEECSKMEIFKDFIPISARRGANLDIILPKILEFLPEGPKFYPDDHLTDKPQRFFVRELIRQQVLLLTREEVPHAIAVSIEQMKKIPKKDVFYIDAVIFVERPSQKAIIIGKRAQMLKAIGEAARAKIQDQIESKIFLHLLVKVCKNWRRDPRALKMLGYA